MEPARAVFVSDAHLERPPDPNYRRMLAFLEGLQGLPDLVILGDFFAFWMGFNRVPERYRPVVAALAALARSGTRIHYVEGNHDLDVGRYFIPHLGARVHPERAELTLGGRRLLLAHGDTIDRRDRGYRLLRALLRAQPLKGLARTLSPEAVLKLADPYTVGRAERVQEAGHLPALLERYARARWADGYDGVVMGHCHHDAFVTDTRDGRAVFYANLGDWVTRFTYLTFDGQDFALRRFE